MISFEKPNPSSVIEIFKSFNLKIKSGKVLGIVGKVGSGKTTVMDLI